MKKNFFSAKMNSEGHELHSWFVKQKHDAIHRREDALRLRHVAILRLTLADGSTDDVMSLRLASVCGVKAAGVRDAILK